jgi:HK97 family phage major capsid protein
VPYNNVVSRTDASALIPEEVATEVISRATEQSAALTLFRRVPVARGQLRMPVLSALPTAYWVNGDTGLKQTTEVNWANKFLNIEELALIMPVPEAVFEDADYDIWTEAMPLLTEAIGRAFDAAVFFGSNAPASFPTNINSAAAAAGNSTTEGATAAQGGAFGDLDGVLAQVEADGFDVTGWAAARTLKSRLRAARSTQGEGLDRDRVSTDLTTLDGNPVSYAMRGLYPSGGGAGTNVRAFALDGSEFVVGIRRDITLKMLDQAVIQDNTGAIQYNLAQQDMVAARLTFRAGWQVSNVINYDQQTEANRYPAGVLVY